MIISTEEKQIPLALEGVKNPDFSDGNAPVSRSLVSPQTFDDCTDVNVVPEHEKNQLEQSILMLEGELMDLKLKQRSYDDKRRQVLNKILDIKGCIRVFCRIRPFLSTSRRIVHQPISVESERIVIRSGGSKKEFGFDKVFSQESSQEDVFCEVDPIIRSALDGRNVCLLAYGQTGTGKTFTMDGTNDSPGIVPRALKTLFQQASLGGPISLTFAISMLEVYLGSLRDLLAPRPASRTFSASKCTLNIQTDKKGLVEIEGLTEVQISDFGKALRWYTKGRRVRSTSWTNVNNASSRSHCLTRITIYRRGDAAGGKPEICKLWMVDLGGSERLLKTGATGQTLDEGRAINLSLSALGDVIATLRRKRGHVPYRNSKLTQILRDSLGDRSKVLMLIHASPFEEDVMETTCSLTFGTRARAVESNKELIEDTKMQKKRRIAELQEEMKAAEQELVKVGHQIQKTEFLLGEKKNLFSATYMIIEDEENIPRSAKTGKAVKPAPRFMKSTASSRQRHIVAEESVMKGRARSLRWGTTSIQISGSQSLSYSDPRFKAFLKLPNKKYQYGEINTSIKEIVVTDGSDSIPSDSSRAKMVSSDPNLRATFHRHRRRMSDLI